MNRMKRSLALLLTALMGAALAACGGGEEGGGAELSSVPYTGNTGGAVITTQNATEIALSAYAGGQMDGMAGVLPMGVGPEGAADANQVPRLEYLIDLAQDLRDKALSGSSTPDGAIQMQNYSDWWPENGQCGGTAQWSGTSDPDAANGSVTFIFTNYCDGGITLSGKIKVDWSMVAATVTFDPLNVRSGFTGMESLTIGGKVRFTWSDNSDGWVDTTTLNMVLVDQVAGNSYKFENYRLSETFSHVEMFEQFALSGRYYDFDHGRVDITTTTPVHISWADAGWWPRQGIIQFNGGSSSVRMNFLSDGVMIEWRAGLSGDNWQIVEIIPRNEFDVWF